MQAARSGAAHLPSPLDSADAHRAAATPPPDKPTAPGETELAVLCAQVAEGVQALSTLLRQCAELDVDRRLAQLGARVTPAMANLAKPLLVELLAERTPATVKLQADPVKPPAEVSIAAQVLQILAAVAGQVLTFGREPVYIRAAGLPRQLADDRSLRIEIVDSAPSDMEIIELLKPERVQDPITPSVAPTRRKRG